MSIPIDEKPKFSDPPTDPAQMLTYIRFLLRQLEATFDKINQMGELRTATLNISDLPTASTGLKRGDLWRDGEVVKVKL